MADVSNVKIINLITMIHQENINVYSSLLIHAGIPKEKVEEIVTDMNRIWNEVLTSE